MTDIDSILDQLTKKASHLFVSWEI